MYTLIDKGVKIDEEIIEEKPEQKSKIPNSNVDSKKGGKIPD